VADKLGKIEIIGHRGNGAGTGENTLANCQRALELGATRLELDLRLEGQTVITSHDSHKKSDTLANILANVSVPLLLHVKEGPSFGFFQRGYYRPLIDRVVPLIAGRPDIVLLSSAPGALTYCKRRYPQVKTAFATLWAGYDLHLAKRLGASEFGCWHRTLTSRAVRLARRKGVGIIAFVPPGTKDARRRLAALDIDGVIVDDIKPYVAAFGRL